MGYEVGVIGAVAATTQEGAGVGIACKVDDAVKAFGDGGAIVVATCAKDLIGGPCATGVVGCSEGIAAAQSSGAAGAQIAREVDAS
ncbi:MAG: hypothetical protein EBV34_16395 [Betaproteobacteria bacterium]|nr:hypothetical protein [Betaproteobacteria bacterium]